MAPQTLFSNSLNESIFYAAHHTCLLYFIFYAIQLLKTYLKFKNYLNFDLKLTMRQYFIENNNLLNNFQ